MMIIKFIKNILFHQKKHIDVVDTNETKEGNFFVNWPAIGGFVYGFIVCFAFNVVFIIRKDSELAVVGGMFLIIGLMVGNYVGLIFTGSTFSKEFSVMKELFISLATSRKLKMQHVVVGLGVICSYFMVANFTIGIDSRIGAVIMLAWIFATLKIVRLVIRRVRR